MRRLLHLASSALTVSRTAPSRAARRLCATVPSEDEVVRAYGVLGVQLSSPFADVKKRYLSLAKEHHPDVSTSTAASSSTRMVDINHAYSVVTRFHKAGRTLSAARTAKTHGTSGSHSWTNAQREQPNQSQYRPWHEDVDPLLYEMMWEEMRRQNEEEAFAQSMNSDGFDGAWSQAYPFYAQYQQQHPSQQRRWKPHNGKKQQQQQQQPSKPVKTTTWPETDLKALVNMYQDGKSFEFIANALGKETAGVVEEFNRWSDDSKKNRQQQNSHKRKSHQNNQRRQAAFYDGPYYYTESPDDDIPFEFYDMMGGPGGVDVDDDVGDPYGYYDEDELYEGGAMPFTGTHYMHGTPQHTHKAYNGGNSQKRKNQGSSQHRRNRRKQHSSNNNNNQNRRQNNNNNNAHNNNKK